VAPVTGVLGHSPHVPPGQQFVQLDAGLLGRPSAKLEGTRSVASEPQLGQALRVSRARAVVRRSKRSPHSAHAYS